MNCPGGCWHTTNHSPTWMIQPLDSNICVIISSEWERLEDPRLSCIICYMLYIGYVIWWYVYNIFSPLIWKFCWKLLFIFTWYNNRWFMSNLCVRFCQIFSPIIIYAFSSNRKGSKWLKVGTICPKSYICMSASLWSLS